MRPTGVRQWSAGRWTKPTVENHEPGYVFQQVKGFFSNQRQQTCSRDGHGGGFLGNLRSRDRFIRKGPPESGPILFWQKCQYLYATCQSMPVTAMLLVPTTVLLTTL